MSLESLKLEFDRILIQIILLFLTLGTDLLLLSGHILSVSSFKVFLVPSDFRDKLRVFLSLSFLGSGGLLFLITLVPDAV